MPHTLFTVGKAYPGVLDNVDLETNRKLQYDHRVWAGINQSQSGLPQDQTLPFAGPIATAAQAALTARLCRWPPSLAVPRAVSAGSCVYWSWGIAPCQSPLFAFHISF